MALTYSHSPHGAASCNTPSPIYVRKNDLPWLDREKKTLKILRKMCQNKHFRAADFHVTLSSSKI
jgi:hypothetical protein